MSHPLIARAEELTRKAAAKFAEANALASKETLTADESARFDALTAEAKGFEAEATAARSRAEQVEANEAAIAATTAPRPRRTAPESSEPMVAVPAFTKDPKAGYRSLAEFAADVHAAGPAERPHNDRLKFLSAASGMNQSVGTEGGFAVPPTFSTSIWDGMRTAGDNLMARCDTYTIEGESLTMLANAETSRATGSRYGGIRGYWLAEASQVTPSTPKLRQVKLQANQVGVLVYVTDKLLRNNQAALDQYLSRAAGEELNFMINDAIVNGSGAGQPLGLLASGSLVSVSKEVGQAAATIVKANIDKMWTRLAPRSWASAVWFINIDTMPQLQSLSAVVGVGGVPVFLPPGGVSASPYATLYGRPVVPIESCATLGTVGDIVLADLSTYALGIQGGVEQAQSIHLRFDYAETAFRFLTAVDGQPWLGSVLTPFKGSSNTLSTHVALATRS